MTTSTPQLLTYENLPETAPLTPELGEAMIGLFNSSKWVDTFNCITALRSINKYNSNMSAQVIQHFLEPLGKQLHNGVTLVVKNSLLLMKQLFMLATQTDVSSCVVFFSYVLKKSVLSNGSVKEMAMSALQAFVNFMSYEQSIKVSAENCFDNNPEISQVSLKVFYELIKKTNENIMKVEPQTMSRITLCLSTLLDAKRQNVKLLAHEISMYILNTLGSENFIKLLNFTLGQQKAQDMMNKMNNKHNQMIVNQNNKELRQSKIMRPSFASKNKQNYYQITNSQIKEYY